MFPNVSRISKITFVLVKFPYLLIFVLNNVFVIQPNAIVQMFICPIYPHSGSVIFFLIKFVAVASFCFCKQIQIFANQKLIFGLATNNLEEQLVTLEDLLTKCNGA